VPAELGFELDELGCHRTGDAGVVVVFHDRDRKREVRGAEPDTWVGYRRAAAGGRGAVAGAWVAT